MTFNKTQLKKLSKYESKFRSAVDVSFCRIESRDILVEIDEIYKEAIGNYSGLIGGCNRCTLNAMKKIGQIYFKDKEELEELNKSKKKNKENGKTEENS